MTDMINHPPHYAGNPDGIECIQVTRHMNFNRGNAVKYIWRADSKGDPIENLRKAAWYINDEIERLEKTQTVECRFFPGERCTECKKGVSHD